jgi:hypothetical protein
MIRTSHSVLGTFDLRSVWRAAGRCPESAQTRARPNVCRLQWIQSPAEAIRVSPVSRRRVRRVLALGMLAVLLLLSEGSAMDWSSLHAQQHLGVCASQGALALGSFVVAMTVSRFIMDRVAQGGPVGARAERLAIAGILAVIAPNLPVALIGWALPGSAGGGLRSIQCGRQPRRGQDRGVRHRAAHRWLGIGHRRWPSSTTVSFCASGRPHAMGVVSVATSRSFVWSGAQR